jgi:hypothetical protein
MVFRVTETLRMDQPTRGKDWFFDPVGRVLWTPHMFVLIEHASLSTSHFDVPIAGRWRSSTFRFPDSVILSVTGEEVGERSRGVRWL